MMVETAFISESTERAIIYCILNDEGCLLKIMEEISVNHFNSSINKTIFSCIFDLFTEGQKIINTNVTSSLPEKESTYFMEILRDKSINISNFNEYLTILKNKYLVRQSDIIASTIKKEAREYNTGSVIINNAFERFNDLLNLTTNNTNLLGDNLFDLIPDPDNYDPSKIRNIIGLGSGFYNIDKYTCGFPEGSYVIIAGRPSSSKTLFLRQMFIYNACSLDIPVLLISVDEPEKLVKLKSISTITGIDFNRLKRGELDKGELASLKKHIERIKEMPFLIDTTPNLNIAMIRAKIKKALYRYPNLGAVGIDYVQQLGVTNEELTHISMGIKNLGLEFNIPMFAVSQLSRGIETRKNENMDIKWDSQPLLSDLRQSGELEQGADKVLFIAAEPAKTEDGNFKKERKVRVWISKQRDGIAGVYVDMVSIGNIQTMQEMIVPEKTTLPF